MTRASQIVSLTRAGARPIGIAALFESCAVGNGVWAPDGSTVAFVTNVSGRRNLWLVPVRGGPPTQLTFSEQRQTNLRLVAGRSLDRIRLRIIMATRWETSSWSR